MLIFSSDHAGLVKFGPDYEGLNLIISINLAYLFCLNNLGLIIFNLVNVELIHIGSSLCAGIVYIGSSLSVGLVFIGPNLSVGLVFIGPNLCVLYSFILSTVYV
jgi:hypothetical protein